MKHRYFRKRNIGWGFLIVLVLLVAVRLALPFVILKLANRSLDSMDGYRGHIEDIDLAIIRGAYTIDGITLQKVDSASGDETPFLAAKSVDLSIEWRSLFKGSLVGEIIVKEPVVRFTKDKVEPDDVQKDSSDFRRVLDEFMPLNINRLELTNGTLQYVDNTTKPRVDIRMTEVDVLALNLRNSYDSSDLLPATVNGQATIYDGRLDMKMKMNPLAAHPTFDMNAEWKNTNLVKLNDFFQAYAKVDVNKGAFGLYAEIAAKEGRFAGYVKPLLEDVDILGKEDRKDNILRKAWEGLSGSVTEIFENQRQETFATKIPFRGTLDDPRANIWQAIIQVLQNAFIRALQPSIDQQVDLGTVDEQAKKKGVIEKLFGGKSSREEKREK